MKILNGLPPAQKLRAEIVEKLNSGQKLHFVFILDAQNKEAVSYVKATESLLDKLAIGHERLKVTNDADFKLAQKQIKASNNSFVIARPLPGTYEAHLVKLLPPEGDPDMISPLNKAKAYEGDLTRLPATAQAVLAILDYYGIDVTGQKTLVIGRSPTVGLPVFMGLMRKNAFVSLAHSKVTKEEINKAASQAAIIVLASGIKGLLQKETLNSSQIIIDCGYHAEDGSGDLGFVPVEGEVAAYTPVPAGIGPLAVTYLIKNALELKQ